MKINIDKNLIEKALIHSEDRINYEFNRFHLDMNKRKSMILIGTIGQLVFMKYLDEKHIPYEFEFQAGRYDNYDFKVKDQIVEIKTSGYENYYDKLNLLYSEDQFQNGLFKKFKYCVQIFINGYNRKTKMLEINNCNSATIAGYIKFENIQLYKHEKKYFGDDFIVPLTELSNVENLLSDLIVN